MRPQFLMQRDAYRHRIPFTDVYFYGDDSNMHLTKDVKQAKHHSTHSAVSADGLILPQGANPSGYIHEARTSVGLTRDTIVQTKDVLQAYAYTATRIVPGSLACLLVVLAVCNSYNYVKDREKSKKQSRDSKVVSGGEDVEAGKCAARDELDDTVCQSEPLLSEQHGLTGRTESQSCPRRSTRRIDEDSNKGGFETTRRSGSAAAAATITGSKFGGITESDQADPDEEVDPEQSATQQPWSPASASLASASKKASQSVQGHSRKGSLASRQTSIANKTASRAESNAQQTREFNLRTDGTSEAAAFTDDEDEVEVIAEDEQSSTSGRGDRESYQRDSRKQSYAGDAGDDQQVLMSEPVRPSTADEFGRDSGPPDSNANPSQVSGEDPAVAEISIPSVNPASGSQRTSLTPSQGSQFNRSGRPSAASTRLYNVDVIEALKEPARSPRSSIVAAAQQVSTASSPGKSASSPSTQQSQRASLNAAGILTSGSQKPSQSGSKRSSIPEATDNEAMSGATRSPQENKTGSPTSGATPTGSQRTSQPGTRRPTQQGTEATPGDADVSKTSPQQQPSPTQAPDFADQSSMSYDQKVAAERTKQQIFSTPKSKTPSMVEHEAKLAEERTQQTILTPQLQRAVNKLPGFRSDEPDQGNERIMPELPAHLMQFFPGGVANNLLQYYSSTGKPLPQGSPTAASTRHGTNVTGNDATSNLLTDYDYDDDDTTLSSSDEDESY